MNTYACYTQHIHLTTDTNCGLLPLSISVSKVAGYTPSGGSSRSVINSYRDIPSENMSTYDVQQHVPGLQHSICQPFLSFALSPYV